MARQGQDGSDQFGRFRRGPDDPIRDLPPKPRFPHDIPILTATLSVDRKTLVALDAEGTINGWDAVRAKRLYRCPAVGRQEPEQRLTASPCGRFVVVSSRGLPPGPVRILDLRSGRELRRIERGFSPSFSPDGEFLACSDGPQLRRWALKSGAELPRFTEAEQPLKWTTWSPKGDMLAASRESSSLISLWEAGSRPFQGRILESFKDEAPTSLAFSPDGKMLAIGSHWGIKFESLAGPPDQLYRSHEEYAQGPLKFSPDGRRMSALSRRRRLLVWETTSGKPLFTWAAYELDEGSLDLSEGGDVAIWIERGGIRLERIPLLLGGYEDGHVIRSLCFTAAGQVVTGDDQGTIRFWDPATQKEVRRHAVPLRRLRYVSRDGAWAVFGGKDEPVGIWDLAAGREILKVEVAPAIQSIALSPDNSKLALGHSDGSVTLWGVVERKELTRIRSDVVDVSAICWSRDGKSLAWGDQLGVVVIAEGEQGQDQLRFRTRGGAAIRDLRFSPDGRTVFARDATGLHRAYSDPGVEPKIVDGELPLVAHPRMPGRRWHASGCFQKPQQLEIVAAAVSPDGSYIAGVTRAGKLVIWEAPGAQ